MTYTKTPWHICEVTGRNLKLIRDENGYCVAEAVKPANSSAAYIDHIANAHLIAAAPEMLAALDTLVWQLDRMDGLPDELERMVADAKAAIAKARGEAA
jgi:hypothetical protein